MDKTIGAAAFKAQCLALIEEVATTGKPITVTKRGKPRVVVSAAPPPKRKKSILDALAGAFVIPPGVDMDAEIRALRREMGQAMEDKWDRLNGPAAARHQRADLDRGKQRATRPRRKSGG